MLTVLALVLAWAQATDDPDTPALAAGNVLVGVGFAGTALLLRGQPSQRFNANLFAAVALVWTAQQVAAQTTGWFAPVGYFLGAFTQVLAAAALLRYPEQRTARTASVFISITFGLTTLFALALLGTARADWIQLPAGAWQGPLEDRGLFQLVTEAKLVWLLLSACVFVWLLLRRWASLGGLERRTVRPIVATATVVAVATACRVLGPWLSPAGRDVLGIVLDYAAALLALAFLLSALQMRLARTSIAELVTRMSGPASVEAVRDGLREALADPDLEVFYWVPERGAYVDALGAVVNPWTAFDGHLVTPVAGTDGTELAVLVADESLRRHSKLVGSAVAVSRLALENARLQAGLRMQLAAAQSARARLLHSGLEQRRRLERDLHDGAQQRLLALGMRLGAIEAATWDVQTSMAVRDALAELQLALAELRDLAHGLYPAVLSQGGLAAALEAVAERVDVPIHLQVPIDRWHPDVESAAYLTACEALTNAIKHSGASQIRVEICQIDHTLSLVVTDDGRGCAELNSADSLLDLRSRLGALGGELTVASLQAGGTTVSALIPTD